MTREACGRTRTREPSATCSFDGPLRDELDAVEEHAVEDVVAAELARRPPRPSPAGSGSSSSSSGRISTSTALAPFAFWAGKRPTRRLDDAVREPSGQEVAGADELGRPAGGGGEVELLRRALLHDRAVPHQRDPVGERERLLAVVRDEHDGDVDRAEDAGELVAHRAAQVRVDVRPRLVEQHELRARARARARARRAAAGRPRARADSGRRGRRGRRRRAGRARGPRARGAAGRSRRSRPRSGAGRARSPGRPSRPGAARAAPRCRRPRRACRSSSIVPASGASKPAIRRSSVVLPQPDGPSSATNSPRSTQSCASSTAWTAPKRFDTPWQQIIPHAM